MRRFILTIITVAAVLAASAQRVGGTQQPTRTQTSRQGGASVSRQAMPARTQPSAQYGRTQTSVSRTQQPRPSATAQPSTRRPPQSQPQRPSAHPSKTVTVTRHPDGTVTRAESSRPDYSTRPAAQPQASDRRSDMPDGYKVPEKPREGQARQPDTDKRGYNQGAHPDKPGDGHPGEWNGHPGGPSFGHVRPVPHGFHPRPPMHHPIHHRPIHMRYHKGIDWVYGGMIWHGYWGYMHRYGYLDRPVLIARVNTWTPSNILIDYIIADNMVFSLYREAYTGDTYFAVTDEYDRTLARVKVGRKYQSLQADDYGVWVLDRRGNDPLYFMLIDGRLYMYDCN